MSYNNTMLTFGMTDDTYPLNEKIILHSGIAIFESQLELIPTSSPDYDFLSNIEFGNCARGACDCKVYPFICVPERPFTNIPTAAEIILELNVANFQSEHITNLHTSQIPYPGYHPGTKNDEIHTNPNKQFMFDKENIKPEDAGNSVRLSQASHQALRSYVAENHLFYTLFHDNPKWSGKFMFSNFVLLFAIGVSPQTGNLVGAVSHQACHNLCD